VSRWVATTAHGFKGLRSLPYSTKDIKQKEVCPERGVLEAPHFNPLVSAIHGRFVFRHRSCTPRARGPKLRAGPRPKVHCPGSAVSVAQDLGLESAGWLRPGLKAQ